MTHQNRIKRLIPLERFKKAYRALSPELKGATDEALRDLLKEFIPNSRRMEKLQGYKNPNVFTIHVTPNHSHKLAFEVEGDVAYLRTVDTHKVIDRKP